MEVNMGSYTTELKVGIFTIAAIVVMGFMFLFLNPKSLDRSSYKNYYTIIDDASGIIPRSQIKTSGVVIGEVAEVTLSNNRTKITFSIDSKVPVPKGSKVEIRTRGLLGDVFVEIIRSADKGEYIAEGGYIPKSDDTVDLQSMVALFGSIAKDVKKITSSLSGSMEDKSGESNIGSIMANLKDLTADLKGMVASNKKNINSIVQNVENTTRSLGEAMQGSSGDLRQIIAGLKATSQNFSNVSSKLNGILSDENSERISASIASLDETMNYVRDSADVLGKVMQKVENGEGTIGKLLNDDSTIEEVEGTMKDIRNALNPINNLRIYVDYHGELAQNTQNRNYFNLNFYTRKDKYYVLGITDRSALPRSLITSNVTTTNNTDGVTTVTDETKEDEPSITFNAQMAKRFGFAGVRFGLFESKGGFATDLYMFNDNLKFSVEAFNWQTKGNEERRVAHIKSYASLHFLKYLYAVAGVDDVTRYKQNTTEIDDPSYFFGAGFSFNDEDLRSILGLASLAR